MLFQTHGRPTWVFHMCYLSNYYARQLSTIVWRWSTVWIKVIRIWRSHHPPLQRQQLLWCAGMNTSKCMWLNIVSYYCLLGDFSEVNSKSFTLSLFELHIRGRAWNQMLLVFWLSHGTLFERFISNSYSCQADLKLWHFRNVWFSPKPSLKQTELKLSTTCVQSNTCWLLRISSPDWTYASKVFVLVLCQIFSFNITIHLWIGIWLCISSSLGLLNLRHWLLMWKYRSDVMM